MTFSDVLFFSVLGLYVIVLVTQRPMERWIKRRAEKHAVIYQALLVHSEMLKLMPGRVLKLNLSDISLAIMHYEDAEMVAAKGSMRLRNAVDEIRAWTPPK